MGGEAGQGGVVALVGAMGETAGQVGMGEDGDAWVAWVAWVVLVAVGEELVEPGEGRVKGEVLEGVGEGGGGGWRVGRWARRGRQRRWKGRTRRL